MLNSIHPIILIVVGSVISLFGYKIQKLVLTLGCFALGYTISSNICPNFITDSTTIIIVNIIAGIIIASLGYKIEKLAVAGTVAYLVYTSLTTYAGIIPYEMTNVIKLIASLVCGIIALLLIKPILIITTSIGGISILLNGLVTYITIPSNIYFIVLICAILLSTIIQFKTN